jgi:hypothetical protein
MVVMDLMTHAPKISSDSCHAASLAKTNLPRSAGKAANTGKSQNGRFHVSPFCTEEEHEAGLERGVPRMSGLGSGTNSLTPALQDCLLELQFSS